LVLFLQKKNCFLPASWRPDMSATLSIDSFSDHNFNQLAALIQSYSGIKMPPAKRTMLATRLRPRLTALGLDDVDAYCGYLFEAGGLTQELIHLVNAVTTNKTDFFREPVHFEFLRDHILPTCMAAGQREVKLWSAAASIGAEAYTAAMVLEEFRRANRGPDYSILATDISTEVLELAVKGQYASAMLDPVPSALRGRYLLQARDPKRDQLRIIPQLRAKIAWGRVNLMDEHYQAGRDMDVIFCRNILIYFDRPTQHKVLARLCRHLAPGGYLILGHSESGAGADLPVVQVQNTIFQQAAR